jgi:hypothetical protein
MELLRGVKQGDPLSPYIFNTMKNPLLELEELRRYAIDDAHSISCLAFEIRRCETGIETRAHILGQCTHTKSQRIKRHSDIGDFLAERVTSNNKKARVIVEEFFKIQAATMKPDLVVIDRGRVHVVDVTVRHEDLGYLQEGYHDKISKYSPLLQHRPWEDSAHRRWHKGSNSEN